MAIFHGYSGPNANDLPRVVMVSITRAAGARSDRFVVRLHEEGTPVAWRRDVVLRDSTLAAIAKDLVVLDDFAQEIHHAAVRTAEAADRIGRRLFETFLGSDGAEFLAEHPPTAVMIDADETALDLPWELLRDEYGLFIHQWPFGRLVTTTTRPKPERDPQQEEPTVTVLAVVDPTREFSSDDQEIEALKGLADRPNFRLDILERDAATSTALAERISQTPYDIIHFSTHGGFSTARPGESGLLLADGPLLTSQILELPWNKPPYMAIVSACWSGRSAPDRRLTSVDSGSNGVAAAFLASGASSCLGFGWPVHVSAAADFVGEFYRALDRSANVGTAVFEAREHLRQAVHEQHDLAGLGAVFYGDVGTSRRRDLQKAEPPQPPHPPPDTPDPTDMTRLDLATAS
jgi:hypothetical protein